MPPYLQRKKKMSSPCKGKRNLSVDDFGDWEEDCENEEDEDNEGEAFY